MIIIVANDYDPHADAVILALKNKGFDQVLRFDLEAVGQRFNFSLSPNTGAATFVQREDIHRSCDAEDVKTIWWRRSTSHLRQRNLDYPEANDLDEVECYWALRWFLEAFPDDKFPFGHPNKFVDASNKLLQLRMANDIGFSTPQTIFTNHPDSLRSFAKQFSSAVLKPLRTSLCVEQSSGNTINIIARPVSYADLDTLLGQQEKPTSAYCQDRVLKIADIRVNILPRYASACYIDGASLSADEVDWRPKTGEMPHRHIDLPRSIEVQCRSFLSRLGLRWGAFDFGLLESGEWVFFECNPNGQWLWIEFMTDIPLADSFADELIRHHGQ